MPIAITPDLLSRTWQIAQTVTPDFTQPQYLNQVASQLPISIAIFIILAIALSAAIASS